jgi:hypothetical protein
MNFILKPILPIDWVISTKQCIWLDTNQNEYRIKCKNSDFNLERNKFELMDHDRNELEVIWKNQDPACLILI